MVNIEVTPKDFGRISAMTAKQVVTQRIREAERGIIYSEYTEKTNDIVSGTIERIEKGNVFIDIGKIEAMLPEKEQPIGETCERSEKRNKGYTNYSFKNSSGTC